MKCANEVCDKDPMPRKGKNFSEWPTSGIIDLSLLRLTPQEKIHAQHCLSNQETETQNKTKQEKKSINELTLNISLDSQISASSCHQRDFLLPHCGEGDLLRELCGRQKDCKSQKESPFCHVWLLFLGSQFFSKEFCWGAGGKTGRRVGMKN